MLKLTLNTNELKEKLALVIKASNLTTPVSDYSRCVLIEVEKATNELVFTCCNYAMEIKSRMSVDIETTTDKEPKMFVLEVESFSKFVNKLPSNETKLTIENNICKINSGRVRFSLGLFGDANTFPHCVAPETKEKVTFEGAVFAEKSKKTIFASTNPKSNQMMGGMHMTIKNGKVELTCLDGHRVAINSFELTNTIVADKDCVIPVISIKTILSNIAKAKEVSISMDEKNIAFSFDGNVVYIRLLDGNFFAIEKMVSNKRDINISINRLDLLEAVSRAELVTQLNATTKRPVIFEFAKDSISVTANNGPGEMKEDIDATCENLGNMKDIAFNPIFIREMLSVISDDIVRMELIGPKAPMYVVGEDYTYLTLPVNIQR